MSISFRVLEPNSKDQFESYYQLRWEVLRNPWGQPKGSERDQLDSRGIHRMVLNENNNTIGVGMILFNSLEEAQIRFMAVRGDFQGKNIGSLIIESLESVARHKNLSRIILHSRENGVNFYEKNGFSVVEKSYLLFDSIQHFLMEKKL